MLFYNVKVVNEKKFNQQIVVKLKIDIYLQKIGKINNSILKNLEKDLKKALGTSINSIIILPEIIDLRESDYVANKKQYNGSSIIKQLKSSNNKSNSSTTLGILDVDIFKSKLNFVFGIATNPKHPFKDYPGSAIISVTRLRESFYNKPEQMELFRTRILKEAVHEIGHTIGLKHCNNKCVMQFSVSLTYVDEKPLKFCNDCKDILEDFTNRS